MPGVNDDCYVHYYINNKTLQSLRRIFAYTCSGVETMVDCFQLTQGGSVIKRHCQSTIVGGACAELRHSAKNLWTAWYVKGVII